MILKTGLGLFFTCVAISIGFNACSGDTTASSNTDGNSVKIGVFADAIVQGVSYKTATQSGYTDEKGRFKYLEGESVEFKLGNLSLGDAKASSFVTPYDMSDNNTTAINIALILQNFDSNRSNKDILNLSKLKEYQFTLANINLSGNTLDLENQLAGMLATSDFQNYVDEIDHNLIVSTTVKNNMDDCLKEYKNGNSNDNSNSSNKSNKFNPPEWIQGTWMDRVTEPLIPTGWRFTKDDVYSIIVNNSVSALDSIKAGDTIEQESNSTTYKYKIIHSNSTEGPFTFTKLNDTQIQLTDSLGNTFSPCTKE